MKKIALLLFCVLAPLQMQSQGKEYLDYIITREGDTIFGTFRQKLFKTVLMEKNKTPEKDGIAFYSHSLKNVKAYRYNDFVNVMEKSQDGIYPPIENLENVPKDSGLTQSDYIIKAGDTIYGKINLPLFSVAPVLTTAGGKKIKIKFPDVSSYRQDNFIYWYKKKEKIISYDKEADYLPLLYKGRGVNLYGYYYQTVKYYYIEKDNAVKILTADLINQLFSDDKELMALISDGVYAYENIYLMLKFYSRPERR